LKVNDGVYENVRTIWLAIFQGVGDIFAAQFLPGQLQITLVQCAIFK